MFKKYLGRNIDTVLADWKLSKTRRPLLVRGARQVGKTYSVEHFGQTHFQDCLTVNFEEQPEVAACFDTLKVNEIIDKLSILLEHEILPGSTLLFLDEIQECPQAIMAMRYFFEKMPELHVIGAGSLLEFIFHSADFRMPVGRVSSIFMGPLSFYEFLRGIGKEKLVHYLSSLLPTDKVETVFHNELEKLLRRYLIIGGMPAAVLAFKEKVSPAEIKRLQSSILQTYQADFSKYASTAKHKHLKDVFRAIPRLVGQQIKYTHINPNFQSRDLKNGIELLEDSRCLHQICHSSGNGIPLDAQVNHKKFKMIFLDVGLMQRSLGLEPELMLKELMTVNRGSVAEQYVGQQLLSMTEEYEEQKLFFWVREAKNSQAEVDYLLGYGQYVLPVEVKAGKTGSLKSMRLFLQEHSATPFGLRFSGHDLSWHDDILSIPLYMVEEWQRLAKHCLKRQ